MRTALAIDPSTKPVLASRTTDGGIRFLTLKTGVVGLPDLIDEWFPDAPPDLFGMERPPFYLKGDALQSSIRFAEVCGAISGVFIQRRWDPIMVPPANWMQFVDPENQRPTGKANYRDRKKFFDSTAKKIYKGSLPQTPKFSEGDALCLLAYLESLNE